MREPIVTQPSLARLVVLASLAAPSAAMAEAYEFEFMITDTLYAGTVGYGTFSIPDGSIPPSNRVNIPMTGFSFEYLGRVYTLDDGFVGANVQYEDGVFQGFDWAYAFPRSQSAEMFNMSFDVGANILLITQDFSLAASNPVMLVLNNPTPAPPPMLCP